jgi:hypothetical protein
MTDDDLGVLGPAMSALTARRRQFVVILLQQVRPNYLRAADMGGVRRLPRTPFQRNAAPS